MLAIQTVTFREAEAIESRARAASRTGRRNAGNGRLAAGVRRRRTRNALLVGTRGVSHPRRRDRLRRVGAWLPADTRARLPAVRSARGDGPMTRERMRVYQLENGRFIVAQWLERNACYVAGLTPDVRRVSGCSQSSSRTLEGLSGVQTYKTRASAERARKRDHGWRDD